MKRRHRHKRSVIVGVTGTFGSGKTTVAKALKSLGAELIDADKIARDIIKPGSKIYKRTIDAFGKAVLKKNKDISREKLAGIVFNRASLLRTLNSIMHPEIIRVIKAGIRSAKSGVIVVDAPLLIEAGLRNLVDKLIVVKINRQQQIKRILKSMPIRKKDILKRLRYQIPLRDKVRIADFIIDNSGTLNQTGRQVREIWEKLQPRGAERQSTAS